jgi:sigma-E factor negative regulatory protein RseB
MLEQMADAIRQVNYEGTFVYSRSGRLETMHIVHQSDGGGEREHLVSLDGSRREVIRDGDAAICILGDAKPVLLDKSRTRAVFPGSPTGDLQQLDSHYRLTVGVQKRIAGRDAHELAIEPLDALRYGYRLWMDEVSGLPLMSALIGDDGEILEQIRFTELTLMPGADRGRVEAIMARKAWARGALHASGVRDESVAMPVWRVVPLPAGFGQTAYRSLRMAEEGPPVDHLVFSDGLATVSVYVEPASDDERLNGAQRHGALSTFAAVRDGHQIIVVGDVPMATVRHIGEAVGRIGEAPR